MVSDSELVNRLREILSTSDLNTTTAGAVRRQLEQDFGIDLSDRKKFISQQIDQILHGDGGNEAGDSNEEQDRESVDDEDNNDGAFADGDQENEVKEEDGEGPVEEEEEEEESDEKPSKKKGSNGEETIKKKRGGGFTKVCSLSPQLQEFLGVPELARTEVVKKLWEYIREKDLQDPKNRRNIKCDEKLHSIFRVDTINMFQMNKALSKHIWPLEVDQECSSHSSPREKKQKRQKEEDVEPKRKEKKQKGGTTGFLKPLQLSEAFTKFLSTGETSLSRADAVKRIWDYIKQNNLQDPSDKRIILCDEKLKELFDVDSFKGFAVTKLLTAHLTKMEQ